MSDEAQGWYRHYSDSLRQGDIAITQFHQLRDRSGEPRGPGPETHATHKLPSFGPHADFDLEILVPVPDGSTIRPTARVLRVWTGFVMVLHQNCEIHYADENDARLIVAPLVLRSRWTAGPWDQIRKGSLPDLLYLPELSAEQARRDGIQFSDGLPEAAIAFASMTLVSRGVVKPNRVASLAHSRTSELQAAIVRFTGTRGWAARRDLESLVGRTILRAMETTETVPGPSRLAKLTLGPGADDLGEEVTVVWGLR